MIHFILLITGTICTTLMIGMVNVKKCMHSHSSKFANVWEWETEEWGRVSLGEQAWEQRHGGLFYGNQ